ncbi:DUF3597 domain-containing protein [Falsirhodobacter sp. 20TX0035]|uniref:DUF3597 domain-containing protein n=1 Tax=Falsirhodobacter sp. 20TX0035 TaxID=3022019 RepID=UPI00232F7832|nr:DUF3597 domain-containing protein [Falsirhodobacter sp. 20TX0035]MDB6454040.1 DUF3597 domain-containing protein [Falsirhodobacter sp. 20TX0035]
MSIFSKIKGAIFGKAEAAERSAPSTTPASTPAPAPQKDVAASAPQTTPAAPAPSAAPAPTSAAPTPAAPVDVMASLEATAKAKGSDLNWRTSIVDLMKLLDIDSSLANRKDLAKELHYTGDLDGSAEMNIWLHKAVMRELAKNGGKVPSELTD